MAEIWDSAAYNRSNGAQLRDAEETIQKILDDNFGEIDIIVDIGCGSGNVTSMLSKRIPHKQIIALDFDAQMVEYSQNNCKDSTITFIVQDIGLSWDDLDPKLKELEGKVSLVWSNRVLHWVKDESKPTAVKNISRLLKSGGRCYVNTTLQEDINLFLPPGEREENEKLLKIPSQTEQLKRWKNYFGNSGLSQLEVEYVEKDWNYEDSKLYWDMISYVPEYLKFHVTNSVSNEQRGETAAKFYDLAIRALQTRLDEPPLKVINPDATYVHYGQFRIIGTK